MPAKKTKSRIVPSGESLLAAWVKPRDVSIQPSTSNERIGSILILVLALLAFVAWSIMGQAILALLIIVLATLLAFVNRVTKWMTWLFYATVAIAVSLVVGPLLTVLGFAGWVPVIAAIAVVFGGALLKKRVQRRKGVRA